MTRARANVFFLWKKYANKKYEILIIYAHEVPLIFKLEMDHKDLLGVLCYVKHIVLLKSFIIDENVAWSTPHVIV